MKIKYAGLLFIIIVSCKKYNEIQNDASGDSYIRGRLFLYDALTQNSIGTPLAEKTIQLAYSDSPDSVNTIFSTTTDTAGYFIFKNLDEEKNYRIFFEEKNTSNNIIYSAKIDSVKPPKDTLRLNAYLNLDKEPGLLYTILDSSGAPIKNASICIYANSSFFKEASCDSSTYHLITDIYGHAFIFNIPSIKYYTTAYISVNGLIYIANDTPIVTNSVKQTTLYLTKEKQTGYSILVTDTTGSPIPGVNLCFFTSDVLYNANNCSGSNFQDTTQPDGQAVKNNVTPAKYFINANMDVDSNLSLIGRDTILIQKNIVLNDTIIMKKK